ncbi:sulfatase-like hydrolase/transferase [Pseudokineococcus basanitobsidens]|uniref:Sulfatase-like hydrolase/transferase n=1 Tax=Pseudokineococcus basanitobsidens TaxID=1926649 RepID=A0ABU8RLK0_9ACTN
MTATPAATHGAQRPNIVFVITDQQRFDTIAALGHDHVDTPNLDRLVAEGTAFTRTYVTAPSCAPSRASLFTGLYPHTSGVLRNDDPWHHSWVERLADAGYRCANVGKMHTYPYETSVGFHERHVVENKDRAHPDLPFFLDSWDKALHVRDLEKPDRVHLRSRPDYRESLGAFAWELPDEMHPDNFVGGLARWWLQRWVGGTPGTTGDAPTGQPFFLQVGFPGPHPPYDPTPGVLERYADRDVPMPHRTPEDLAAQPRALQELRRQHEDNDHDAVVHLEDPSEEQMRRQRRHYLANVTMLDEQVGLLRAELERLGVLDDTVVVFTSDHGDCLNDHGHSQKWTMYDPSVRVPALVRGPGVVAGQEVDGLTSMMDLGPTVLELAGVDVPSWMEARSLVPALRGERWPGREHAFSEHARDHILTGTAMMTMVRDDRYKLVTFVDSDEGQLFDLVEDPHEERTLWDDPASAGLKRHLLDVVARWRTESAAGPAAAWAAGWR